VPLLDPYAGTCRVKGEPLLVASTYLLEWMRMTGVKKPTAVFYVFKLVTL